MIGKKVPLGQSPPEIEGLDMVSRKAALERAERLRAIRERLHKETSQRAFAARLGVSQARYNHWERGWPIPSDQIRKIKDITPGITGDYILWGDREGLTMEVIRLLMEDSAKGRR